MRIFRKLCVVSCLIYSNYSFAQDSSPLVLSEKYPEAGKTISITYNTLVSGYLDTIGVVAFVYYLDGTNYPVDEVQLKDTGNGQLTGRTMIPDSAKAFTIKIKSRNLTDNNRGMYYMFHVFSGKKPVRGSFGEMAYEEVYHRVESNAYEIDFDKTQIKGIKDYQNEFALYPESKNPTTLWRYYQSFKVGGSNDEDEMMIKKGIDSLLKTGNEENIDIAAGLYRMVDGHVKADSIEKSILKRFPNGYKVSWELYQSFWKNKDDKKKDSIFQLYRKRFPLKTKEINVLAIEMAKVYTKNENLQKFNEYKNYVNDTLSLATELVEVAKEWNHAGKNLPKALSLVKMGIDAVNIQLANAVAKDYLTIDRIKWRYKHRLDEFSSLYNMILFKQGKIKEALQLQSAVYKRNVFKGIDDYCTIIADYLFMLTEDNNYLQALKVAENARTGPLTLPFNTLKKYYLKLYGNDSGFERYKDSLHTAELIDNRKGELRNAIINKRAPAFKLKGINGEYVSLADHEGKTVVISFWTHWNRSSSAPFLQAMKKVVNEYSQNKDVAFVFISAGVTGINEEFSADFSNELKDSLRVNGCDFNVLLDKAPGQEYGFVADMYDQHSGQDVFVIDKKGNIRAAGFDYYNDSMPDSFATDITTLINAVVTEKIDELAERE